MLANLKVMMMDSVVLGTNALGDFLLLSFDKQLYSREAMMKTCYAFTDGYYVHAVKVSAETTGIYLYKKDENVQDVSTAAKMFLEVLNENQMRHIIHVETAFLHAEIVKKAFSPAISLVEKECESNAINILTSSV